MLGKRPMSTSNYPSLALVWRIFRYLMVRLALCVLRVSWWLFVQSLLFVVGLLRLIASPASSGRTQDEFKDLIRPDSPDNQVTRADGSDGFWRMYLQAYSPRLWRMRRLLPMSAGKNLRHHDREEDH
jgi:hypothetical protein